MNCCNALLTVFINLLRISAPKSSSLGMLWLVSGATLVFAAIILTDLDSSAYFAQRKIQAAYPILDASQNPTNRISLISLFFV